MNIYPVVDKYLYWINFLILLYLFLQFEAKIVDKLQVIFSEPVLSGDIKLIGPTRMLFGNEKFGIEVNSVPVLSLYIMKERFPIQETDYSIGYIPSIFLKISWKICEDIRCNRIASLIISVIYLVLISSALLKIYGSSAAIFGTWFSLIFMALGMQPADSEMIFPNMCILASTLAFIKLYSHHKTGEKRYLIQAILSSGFALNFHTMWGIIINICTFAGFGVRNFLRALKTIGFSEIIKILIIFVLLTFPMFIYFFFTPNKSKLITYHIDPDILMKLKNIYQYVKLFSGQQFVPFISISSVVIASIVFIPSRKFRKVMEYKVPIFSSLLLTISIFTILILSESSNSMDIFLRSTKYVSFYTPFVISAIISHLSMPFKRINNLLKLGIKLLIVVVLLLSVAALMEKSHESWTKYNPRPYGDLEIARPNNHSLDNVRRLIGKSLIPLGLQIELTNYLLEKNINNPYAIVPAISSAGFIDILSKDKIKAMYISCLDKIDDNKLNIIKRFSKFYMKHTQKEIFLIVDHSCNEDLALQRYSIKLQHEIKDKITGETIYYIMKLESQSQYDR